MTKLNKTQLKERDTIAAKLRDEKEKLDAAIAIYNDTRDIAFGTPEQAIAIYNESLGAARTWLETAISEIDEFTSERSDAWQEGDKGQAVQTWRDELEAVTFEDIELEKPDDLELDEIEDSAELLEQIQEGIEQ